MCFVSNFKSLVLLLMPGLLASFPVYAGNINIEYNQKQDKITIQAANASLTQLLAKIANQTGMEIQIDPAVEKTVNFLLPPQPLQQALQKVVKGLSYVIEYKIDEKQQTVVSGLRLLPKGKQDSGQLVSVAVLNARANQNIKSKDSANNIPRDTGIYGSAHNRPSRAIKKPNRPTVRQKSDGSEELAEQGVNPISEVQSSGKVKKKVQPKNYNMTNRRPGNGYDSLTE